MKRVLIVSPNWPPVTYPDMHRARTALPYLSENGWVPLVLHTDPQEQGGARDSRLADTVPPDTSVFQATSVARGWTRWLGLTHVGWRSLPSLYRLGSQIIQREKPDLIFFSTTMFPVMILGPLWAKKHGVPYVLDFQDPWVPETKSSSPAFTDTSSPAVTGRGSKHAVDGRMDSPPETAGNDAGAAGGNDDWRNCLGLKAKLSRAIDCRLEPYALRNVSHIISVSTAYVEMLSRRYPRLSADCFTVLPFGAPELDFEYLQQHSIEQSVFRTGDGRRHWVYAGRGGKDMALALRALFLSLARARQKDAEWNNLRLHFIGTDYASRGLLPGRVALLAEACGVGDLVEEKKEQVGYFESLRCLLDADALLVPGSEDPGYTASKIYPYILARKPLLAVFHEQSSVCQVLRETGAGELVSFRSGETAESVSERITRQWFEHWPKAAPEADWAAFSRYSARGMTRRMCEAFNRALAGRKTA
ncbi:MAG: hypothetical protein WC859_08305 [Elusimicrobiota bacterium]